MEQLEMVTALKAFWSKNLQKTKKFNSAISLTNFEIQKYYQNGTIFNGVYSKDIW